MNRHLMWVCGRPVQFWNDDVYQNLWEALLQHFKLVVGKRGTFGNAWHNRAAEVQPEENEGVDDVLSKKSICLPVCIVWFGGITSLSHINNVLYEILLLSLLTEYWLDRVVVTDSKTWKVLGFEQLGIVKFE